MRYMQRMRPAVLTIAGSVFALGLMALTGYAGVIGFMIGALLMECSWAFEHGSFRR